jgi:hypothetical protein
MRSRMNSGDDELPEDFKVKWSARGGWYSTAGHLFGTVTLYFILTFLACPVRHHPVILPQL